MVSQPHSTVTFILSRSVLEAEITAGKPQTAPSTDTMVTSTPRSEKSPDVESYSERLLRRFASG
jgi:hypothetical protein